MFLNQYWLIFSHHPLWIALCLLAAIAFTIYIYRRTNPPVALAKKITLITLRTLVFFLCFLVLFKAMLGVRYSKTIPPRLAIAVDHSASMRINDAKGSRPQSVKTILHQFNRSFADVDLKFFRFSSRSTPFMASEIDSLEFTGDITDMSAAIETIENNLAAENLKAMVMLSDGNYNSGGNPIRQAEKSTVPIYSVGIGAQTEIPDLRISNVSASAFAYVGEKTPININIVNSGFDRLQTTLRLMQNDSVLLSKPVQINAAPFEKTVTLSFTPRHAGQHKLLLDIGRMNQEKILDNNRQTVYVDVLKSKITILLLAGKVTPEISFLRRHLSQNDRYKILVKVEKNQNRFYNIAPPSDILETLDQVDIFVLIHFPTAHSSDALLQNISKSLIQEQQSLLLFLGHGVDMRKLQLLESFHPLLAGTGLSQPFMVYPLLSAAGKQHPITAVANQNQTPELVWDQLPPVHLESHHPSLWPDSEVLLYGVQDVVKKESKRQYPLLAIRETSKNKSAAFLASGIWQWDLMIKGIHPHNRVYHFLINNAIRWLETRQSDKRVQIRGKSRYHFGERAAIDVQVFNTKLEPLDSAEVVLRLQHQRYERKFYPDQYETGVYRQEIDPQYPGDYTLSARALYRNRQIGRSEFSFTVGEYSKELSVTRLSRPTMQSIALNSGGAYIEPGSLDSLFALIEATPKKNNIIEEKSLWDQPAILFLIILLLAGEWFIRKRAGMV